ncbi:hypothetical protein BAE44_0024009, partial [Dichanthelium oligosanthes]
LGRPRRRGLGLLRRRAGAAQREGAGREACQGREGRGSGGEVPGRGVRAGARHGQGLPPEAPYLRGPHQVPPRRRRRAGAALLPAVQPVGAVVALGCYQELCSALGCSDMSGICLSAPHLRSASSASPSRSPSAARMDRLHRRQNVRSEAGYNGLRICVAS